MEEIKKIVNLNKSITDEELEKMYIDKKLAEKLMMQDEHDEGHEMLSFGMQQGFTNLYKNKEESDPYGLNTKPE